MTIEIVPFSSEHVGDAAALFSATVRSLREHLPALSATFADPTETERRLLGMQGFAAVEGGHLVGYLTSRFPIQRFRRTDRVGAYVPEWGHGVLHTDIAAVYTALHRHASRTWADAGCEVHAITLLENGPAAIDAWFRAGFGMLLVDAVRPMEPIDAPPPLGVTIRAATTADVAALAALDVEHCLHYAAPPVCMVPPAAYDESAWAAFLARPLNTAWLAENGEGQVGFVRFDREFDGSALTEDGNGVFITGAFVRPDHRRRGISAALLDAGLRHYAAAGLRSCALDFEAVNPDAAAFWPRYFTPVCASLMRIPEVVQ